MKRQFILLGALAFFAACTEHTVRKEGFGVHGIDVSHYQRRIDWQQVATQDVHFAFVKASEGQSMNDSIFCKNWDAIKSAGITRGAYHFFRPGVPADLQAWNFLSTVTLEHGDLPPVLDVEVTDGYPDAKLTQGVKTWLDIVENAYKVKPIVYSNQKFYNRYLAEDFSDFPIWIARYTDSWEPSLVEGSTWSFWQYGNRGRLRGISGNVDFNVFQGSLSDLESLTLCRPAPLLDRMPEPKPKPVATVPPPAKPGEPIAANP